MVFNSEVKDGNIVVFANRDLYSKNAVFKCIYWYGDRYKTHVDVVSDYYRIELTPLNEVELTIEKLNVDLAKLERDLVDFNLRDIVTNETKNIRDLIIAKAFSHGEFDEEPPGDISDPVGFKPSEI